MFLVVLGHVWKYAYGQLPSKIIYSFHIPMFFLLSGFVRTDKREPIKTFAVKKFLRFVCPAAFFMLLSIPYYMQYADFSSPSAWYRLFFINGMVAYNDPCWFFLVMYQVEIIDWVLHRKQNKLIQEMIYFFAALMVGYLIYEFRIVLPFGMSKTVISYAYFMIGRIGRIIYNQHPRRAVQCQIMALPVCLLIWYITGIRLNGDISLYGMTLGNYWLHFCAALTGTSCFLFLCRIIDRKTTILREWGKNSIFIICSHYFFIEIFKTIAGVAGIEYTWVYDIFGFLFAVGLMFLYQLICRFVDAKIPLISGKYKGTIRIGKEKICIM